jgi:aspartokinase/homoserine dehydrogenase 1
LGSQENKYCRFGHGLVGGTLINQILESAASIEKKDIKLNVLLLPILKVLLNKTELIRTGKKELDTDGIATI